MRFLQVTLDGILTLTNDVTTPPGPYAILSHTWGADEEEVTFDDLEHQRGNSKIGYIKLQFCVNQAKIDGLQYCWVDTCCINKASLSELDEAIRSMFRWYCGATRCYVYLADVSLRNKNNTKNRAWKSAFRKSRWFKRGWTLQELLAPQSVQFFSQEEESLGTKASLEQQIHEITQIPVGALRGDALSLFSIEERLQWASKRETKKVEDKAYCLLGIFGVSMTLRYGERDEAFRRLQAKITGRDVLAKEKTDLSQLRIVEGVSFDSYGQVHTCCHPDTRRDLLQEIELWTQQPNAPPIFWLNGMAGTGKSTISQTIAERLATSNPNSSAALGASFFFKRGEGDRGSAALLFPTLADQLATRIEGFNQLVAQALDDDPRICSKALGEQFKRLLDEPLRKLVRAPPHRHYIVVIDALDECEKEEDMRTILRLWSTWSSTASIRLRLFVTSRPAVPIRLGFHNIPDNHQDLILHEVPRPVIQHDIFVFLNYAFTEIREDYNREPLGGFLDDHWPGEDTLKTLTDMAVPLFIMAATIFRFIHGSTRPKQRLQEVLTSHEGFHRSEMAQVYIPVLQAMITNTRKEEIREAYQAFQTIIGSVVSLAEPLSPAALADLLGVSLEEVNICLRPLHAVLHVPPDSDLLVRPLHLSFGEYLTSMAAQMEPFGVNKELTHTMLWRQCLQLLDHEDGLHENLCGLHFPGESRAELSPDLLKRRFPPALRYACRYWVYHLKMSPSMLRDNEEVHVFLQKHFLHWLEALSLLDQLPSAIGLIGVLQSKIMGGDSQNVSHFIDDAQRFILANRFIGELAPLQLYSSAIIFAPQNSVVRQACGHLPSWIRHSLKAKIDWGAEVQKLEGHTSSVTAVAFSRDGSRLASASFDSTVRLWDAGTGAEVQKMEGHTGSVNVVAFSRDGSRLASASFDSTVRLWDAGTGAEVQKLEGHTGSVTAVAFSRDGSRLASASFDSTVRLWDAGTGAEVQKLEGHTGSVTAVAFSRDRSRLASASWDSTVRLWDAGTGAEVQKLEGHTDSVNAVAFSRDGSRLASASRDSTVRLWGAGTGAEVQKLEGHTNSVTAVAFSRDGSRLASASRDSTVRLWDTGTGAEVQKLEGHTGSVNTVAFSRDGSRLASASFNSTVRLWDAGTGAEVQKLEGHTGSVTAVAFSRDRSRLASASWDSTVRLWDAGTGAEVQKLEGHTGSVTAVAFSRDRSRLASASWDSTVRLWDAGTGVEVQKLEGHTDSVNAVAFSRDGSRLASASWDSTVRLWDAGTGAEVQKLEGHTSSVTAVAFSRDGSRLASASWDSTVRLWDAGTGAEVQKLEGHTSSVTTVAFSRDGSRLASASFDSTVRLWDAGTGAEVQKLEGHTGSVNAVAFSRDGSRLASASYDSTVRLWNAGTGAEVQKLEGHTGSVTAVAFSRDGSRLASASWDSTVRLWDAGTGSQTHNFKLADVTQLTFTDSGCLITNRGGISLYAQSATQTTLNLVLNDSWVEFNGKRVLWLQHEYRSSVSTVVGDLIAIGTQLGAVGIIQLNLSHLSSSIDKSLSIGIN